MTLTLRSLPPHTHNAPPAVTLSELSACPGLYLAHYCTASARHTQSPHLHHGLQPLALHQTGHLRERLEQRILLRACSAVQYARSCHSSAAAWATNCRKDGSASATGGLLVVLGGHRISRFRGCYVQTLAPVPAQPWCRCPQIGFPLAPAACPHVALRCVSLHQPTCARRIGSGGCPYPPPPYPAP